MLMSGAGAGGFNDAIDQKSGYHQRRQSRKKNQRDNRRE